MALAAPAGVNPLKATVSPWRISAMASSAVRIGNERHTHSVPFVVKLRPEIQANLMPGAGAWVQTHNDKPISRHLNLRGMQDCRRNVPSTGVLASFPPAGGPVVVVVFPGRKWVMRAGVSSPGDRCTAAHV